MNTKNIGITTTFAAVINLVIDVVFIRFIGMWAASLSTLVSYVFLVVYRMIDLKKTHTFRLKKGKIVISLATLISMCLLYYTSFGEMINLIIGCILFCVLDIKYVLSVFKMVYKRIMKIGGYEDANKS